MSDDILAPLPVEQVAAFYSRLADIVDKNKGSVSESLAAKLLRHWLVNRNPAEDYEFDAPSHLQTQSDLLSVLKDQRAIFLTEQKTKAGKWGGLIPRLQGKGYPKWNGVGELPLEYESLVEIPLRYQYTGTDGDKDILYALHGFQLRSSVKITLSGPPASNPLPVVFSSFETQVKDRYDWDYTEHLTVPNPDFGSTDPKALAPGSKTVKVYHRNAQRLELAGLAAPYNVKTKPWKVTDPAISGKASVDPAKSI